MVRLGGFGWVDYFSPLSCLVSKAGLWCGLVDMACIPSEMALRSQLECEVCDLSSVGKAYYLQNNHCQLIMCNVTLAGIRFLRRS